MKNKYKMLLGISALVLSQMSLAKPQENIPLPGGLIQATKTFGISLKPLDATIRYTIKCELNNPTENDALPISFYPEEGAIGETSINGQVIGGGADHSSTNLKKGTSELVMTNVNREANHTLLLTNGSVDKQNVISLTGCLAQSEG